MHIWCSFLNIPSHLRENLLKSDPEECDILGYDASIICQGITDIDAPVMAHSVALTVLCKVTFNCHKLIVF